ncbi:putative very-long-chain (3R)-3-hydroxyacyl-CoA dehydratase [Lupinus albus]|uniref:Very-long-chain (3R)-3-hydroxyacyl-CoA dehydratase n=1 Tax=Lupinus albus TaxID=3870 RepID=A0A6A4P617_LUPAL|nr:putative very-long-chain (3R)-3-hydroxyacyl-CoA dehydratase [Lupinus albus]
MVIRTFYLQFKVVSGVTALQNFRLCDPTFPAILLLIAAISLCIISFAILSLALKRLLDLPLHGSWLRYSTFLLLYPTGISSEVGLIYTSLPFIKVSENYCIRMPNKWNFSFDYFYAAIVALGIYVPGSPHMYRYMLAQRKKALSKSKRE